MTAQKPASLGLRRGVRPEDPVVEQARRRGEGCGAPPVGNGAGWCCACWPPPVKAKSVVEIGTGAGASGLWLLQGMPSDGILTTIDVEPEHQAAPVGLPGGRRSPAAHPRHQRPGPRRAPAHDRRRLRHGRGGRREVGVPAYVEHGVRLLRSGGVLVLDNMLWHDKVADPASRDEQTTVLRDLGKALRDDDRLLPALLPVGDGVLAAVKR